MNCLQTMKRLMELSTLSVMASFQFANQMHKEYSVMISRDLWCWRKVCMTRRSLLGGVSNHTTDPDWTCYFLGGWNRLGHARSYPFGVDAMVSSRPRDYRCHRICGNNSGPHPTFEATFGSRSQGTYEHPCSRSRDRGGYFKSA
jgi:hypothetical protein